MVILYPRGMVEMGKLKTRELELRGSVGMDDLIQGICSFWSSGFGLTGRCAAEKGGSHHGSLVCLVPGLHWNVWVEGMHGLFV